MKNRPETADIGFLKTEPRKPNFRFLNFEVGSVFRKPISEIFIGFRTPLITATKCILQITEQPMQTTNSTHSPHQVECSAGLRYHQQVSSEVWWPNSWQTKPSYSVAVLHHTLHQLARHTSVSCHTSVTSSPASEAHPSC